MGTKAVGGANGKHGRVTLGNSSSSALEICVTEWALTVNVNEEDTTNSCSAGKREFEYGAQWVEGILTMDLDLSAHPLDNPPNFIAGQLLGEALTLYEHTSTISGTVTHWTLVNVKITQTQVTSPAASKVVYVISFKTGDFSFTPQSISA